MSKSGECGTIRDCEKGALVQHKVGVGVLLEYGVLIMRLCHCHFVVYLLCHRLYLATSLSNPHFLPAICIQVTLINFTVTFDALQEQLLSSVVKQVG